MKAQCLFLVLLAGLSTGCSTPDNPYGLDWAVATVAYTGYDAAKTALMKHAYATPGATYSDFEAASEKVEKISEVHPEFEPSPNVATDHSFLFKYEGRKAVYYGRFVQVTNHPSDSMPIFSASEITNLSSFVARLNPPADPVSAFLLSRFSESTRQAIARFPQSSMDGENLESLLLKDLNATVLGPSIYEEDRFRGVTLRPGTLRIMKLDFNPPPGMQISREQITAMFNRMLLEDAYPSNLPMKRQNRMRNYVAIKF